ncbi:MAG: hypothetical protein KAJ07_00560 [Planctomycetes bacterium]|nr:hypothetical protein [Planctomycetota bacterium]
MTKKRTINVDEIWDVSSFTPSSGKSTLTFEGPKHKVHLHLGAYTLDYVAEKLWDIVKERQRQVDSNKRSLRGEE